MSNRDARHGRGSQGDPSPQRWLEEGEELRRKIAVLDAEGKATGEHHVETFRVPPTLRLDRMGAREARKLSGRSRDA